MLNLSLSANKTYYLVAALVLIIVVAAAAIFLFPSISKKIDQTGEAEKPVEKHRVYGEVVEIDYDTGIITIKQKGTELEYKVKLSSEGKVSSIGTQRISKFQDITIGQTIELVSGQPFTSGTSSSGGGPSGGTTGGGSSGGGDSGGGEDEVDEVNVITGFPGGESLPNVGKP